MPSRVLEQVERAFVEHFAHVPARASVSFVGVQPIEVLRFEPIPDERVYISLGMSREAMTNAADAVISDSGPRAELMLHQRDPDDARVEVWRRLAVLAAGPAVEGIVYRSDMTVDLGEPLVPGSVCTGVLVGEAPIAPIRTELGPVQVFEVVPATPNEVAWCRVHGTAALRERWRRSDVDLLDLHRRPVDLG